METRRLNMLPKINRLKKKKEFDGVFKKGKGLEGRSLFIKIARNHLKVSRFGFVVAKSFSKKATFRNKIKRRLRESIRLSLPQIKTGFDLVLVAQKGLEDKKFKEIAGTVEGLLKKAELIC